MTCDGTKLAIPMVATGHGLVHNYLIGFNLRLVSSNSGCQLVKLVKSFRIVIKKLVLHPASISFAPREKTGFNWEDCLIWFLAALHPSLRPHLPFQNHRLLSFCPLFDWLEWSNCLPQWSGYMLGFSHTSQWNSVWITISVPPYWCRMMGST